jgi:hypothetical protein
MDHAARTESLQAAQHRGAGETLGTGFLNDGFVERSMLVAVAFSDEESQ